MKNDTLNTLKKKPIISGLLIGVIIGLFVGLSVDAKNSKRGRYGVITNKKGEFVAPILYGETKPLTLNYIVLAGILGTAIGFLFSKRNVSRGNIIVANSDREWSDKRIDEFIKGVKVGNIVPKNSGHSEDSIGPLSYFSFPEYSCEIHVHWKDETREEMSVAHIKDVKTQQIITKVVDTFTISMLRLFSGLEKRTQE